LSTNTIREEWKAAGGRDLFPRLICLALNPADQMFLLRIIEADKRIGLIHQPNSAATRPAPGARLQLPRVHILNQRIYLIAVHDLFKWRHDASAVQYDIP
jgi:hypothetical protein